MNNNNTNININKDIYKNFYGTLLIEIKKMIKKFQWRRASRRYKQNNLEKFHEIKRKSSQKYYYTPGLKEKISYYRKLRYQMDKDYRKQRDKLALNYYNLHKEEISKKAKIKYQLMKNKQIQNLEINNNVISSY
jgi:hypothetical protein